MVIDFRHEVVYGLYLENNSTMVSYMRSIVSIVLGYVSTEF